ncbi:MAG: FG-GAP repeat protein [Rhodocyclales bacterium]|nr:FG-GAP repeat protein [Rhodocyclales bacterium]
MPKSVCRTIAGVLSVAVVAGCGGGGGGGGGVSGGATTSTPAAALVWGQEAYVKAPNAGATDQLGYSVAIDGDTMVVGALGEASNQTTITNGSTASADNSVAWAGAAYVFRRSGTSWVQEAFLKAPNSGGGDFFGESVAVNGDTVVVGASGESSNQTTITNGAAASADNSAASAGAAYVYKRTGTTWAQEAYLKAPNAGAGDDFGYSVAVAGDTVVVGAHSEASNQTTITNGTTASADNSAAQAGAAYVFKRTGTAWAQQAYLKAANAGANDEFGFSVAIHGDTVVVGAKGEASNQTTITNGTTASADDSAAAAGAAYVFKRSGTTWAQEAYLKAPNAGAGDHFGESVAINGETIVVGASGEASSQTTPTNGTTASGNNSALEAGAAYVFKRTGTTWAQEAYLKAPNAEAGDFFGASVALSGDIAVVGAPHESSNRTTVINGTSGSSDNSAASAGAAYVFKRTGTTWARQAYLKAPNAESDDYFGISVAVSGTSVVAGAQRESSSQTSVTNGTTASADNSALNSGATYVFRYR